MNLPKYLSGTAAARELGFSDPMVPYLVDRGRLVPDALINGRPAFLPSTLEKFRQERQRSVA